MKHSEVIQNKNIRIIKIILRQYETKKTDNNIQEKSYSYGSIYKATKEAAINAQQIKIPNSRFYDRNS